ncbi:MAG: OmpA family protein [Nitrospirae bacterium]|nr:OmpA family protein [Nitrospirota bacterium]
MHWGRWTHTSLLGIYADEALTQDGEKHLSFEGHYALAYRPWYAGSLSRLGLAVSVEGRRYDLSSSEDEATTLTLGDTTFTAHYAAWTGREAAVALLAPIRILARPGGGPSLNSASPEILVAASYRSRSASEFLSHGLDLNVGYFADQANAVLKRTDAGANRRTRLAQGAVSENAYILRGGYSAELQGWDTRPIAFLEVSLWKDADGKALNSKGERVDLPGGYLPIFLTPGLKVSVRDEIQVQAAIDLGVLASNFPAEHRAVPGWRIWSGLSWIPARDAPPPPPPVAKAEPSPAVAAVPPPPPPPAAPEPPPPPLPPEPAQRERRLTEHVSFERGRAVPDAGSLAQLAPILALLADPEWSVRVEAHTDGFGDDRANQDLSESRARAVSRALAEGGIAPGRIVPVGLGESGPVAPDKLEQGRALNRRAEFVLFRPSSWSFRFERYSASPPPETEARARELASLLGTEAEARLRLEGHADARGTAAANKTLSLNRARAVADLMAAAGVDPSRLVPVGLGEAEPAAGNESEEGRAANRAVDAVLLRPARWSVRFDSNRIGPPPGSDPLLDEIARALSEKPGTRVRIEGHTDGSGPEGWKRMLSLLRAKTVALALVGRGVDAARIETVAYGDTRPRAREEDETGKAENRRVELTLIEPAP